MSIPVDHRLTISVKDAVQAVGLSRPTLYRLLAAGKIDSVKVGERRLLKVQSLLALLETERTAA